MVMWVAAVWVVEGTGEGGTAVGARGAVAMEALMGVGKMEVSQEGTMEADAVAAEVLLHSSRRSDTQVG